MTTPTRDRFLLEVLIATLLVAGTACSRRSETPPGAVARKRPGTPPAAVPTALDRQGLPVGWIDAPSTGVELFYQAPPPPLCPPCPPDAQCSPCPPPFHRFSSRRPGDASAEAAPQWVRFTDRPEGLVVGGLYRMTVRRVPWVPHGEVLICQDRRPRKIRPREECERLRAEFLRLRDAATNRCQKDADCANAPGGIDDCGRVTDRDTAERLYPIYTAIRTDCGLARHCAPRISIPTCVQGRCTASSGRSGQPGQPGGAVR